MKLLISHFALVGGFAFPVFGAGLRPLNTDRPDTTESPYTVDAGHFQFEAEIANAERDGDSTRFTFAELNAKIGLDSSTDLQVVIPVFTHEEGGAEGFGDIQLRLKHNFWGNDSGSTVFALMPFIKLPTADEDLGNGEIEGGLIAPLAFEAPGGWTCAVMTEADFELDEDGSGYHAVFVNSATTSHDLTEHTAAFFEFVSILEADTDFHSEAYFNTGCTWAVTDLFQLDGGFRFGLNNASTDFTPFIGMSAKY